MSNARTQVKTNVGTAYDAGLRSYMLGVYNYMMLAMLGIGAFAFFANLPGNEGILNLARGLYLPAFLVLIGLGFFSTKLYMNPNPVIGQVVFWGETALWGVIVTAVTSIYVPTSVLNVFFMTAAIFGSVSLLGYTTKRDLAPLAQAAFMIMMGLLLVLLVNVGFAIFAQQPLFAAGGMISMGISAVVVVLIAIVTAWETQKIKQMYYAIDNAEGRKQYAIFGASQLLSSFVVMFIHLLNLFGVVRE